MEKNALTGAKVDTGGLAWWGNHDNWLFDFEGASQWGDFGGQPPRRVLHLRRGLQISNLPWSPALWGYFDWASGDPTLGNGFDQLFPLAHKYLGYMDLYGRRNINDANILLTAKPHSRLTLLAWYHVFRLEQATDVPYSVVMTPFVTTPGGSKDLGEELDLTAAWDITPRWNLLFGFSYFWSGAFYDTNPAVPYSGDASFFYTQSQWDS